MPSLCFPFDLSSSLFHPPFTLFFPSLCYPGAGGNSCCTASTLASYASSQAFPINHGRMLTTVCREELQTFWVSDFETSGFAKSLGKADNVSKSAVGMYVLRKSWPVSSIREYFTKATGPLTGVSPLWGKWGFRILLIGVAGGKMRNISYRIIVVPRAACSFSQGCENKSKVSVFLRTSHWTPALGPSPRVTFFS